VVACIVFLYLKVFVCFIKQACLIACNCFQIWGGVDNSILWLSSYKTKAFFDTIAYGELKNDYEEMPGAWRKNLVLKHSPLSWMRVRWRKNPAGRSNIMPRVNIMNWVVGLGGFNESSFRTLFTAKKITGKNF
jgi:hypothetical protein